MKKSWRHSRKGSIMDDDDRTQPITFEVDTLEALAKILRAGARLSCNANNFFVLEGPSGKNSAGGSTIASAVSGYIETVLHARTLTRKEGLDNG